jgi:hypothetical protein
MSCFDMCGAASKLGEQCFADLLLPAALHGNIVADLVFFDDLD